MVLDGELQKLLASDTTPDKQEPWQNPKAPAQRFLLKSGDAVHVYSTPQAITLQLRHEVPTEVDTAATSFKASLVLTPADALAIAGELLTVAATQVRSKA